MSRSALLLCLLFLQESAGNLAGKRIHQYSLKLKQNDLDAHAHVDPSRFLQEPDWQDEDIDGLYRGYGVHYADLDVGCPPQRQTVIIDTGSSITGFPCSECIDCGQGHHLNQVYKENESECFEEIACSECTSWRGCNSNNQCKIGVSYVEGSSWHGYEVEDLVAVGGTDGEDQFPLQFACKTRLTGLFRTQLADGIMGMDKNPSSFWQQMYMQDAIDERQFSLCYNLQEDVTTPAGVMILGGNNDEHHKTPMVYAQDLHPSRDWFYVNVRKVYLRSGGGASALSGSENASIVELDVPSITPRHTPIVDSGTTCTYLNQHLKGPFEQAWAQLTDLPVFKRLYISEEEMLQLPTLLFQLQGTVVQDNPTTGATASKIDPEHPQDILVAVPPSSYLEKTYAGYRFCLYVSEYDSGVLGASFMVGNDVFFDVENDRIGFAESDCDKSSLLGEEDNTTIPEDLCNLTCHHGSKCAVGPADYGILAPFAEDIPFLAEVEKGGYHCECSSGHTGVSCEHRYEVCSEKHSGFACFHDGECVKLSAGKYACDCSTAKWAGHPASFAGTQCEYGGKADDVKMCNTEDNDGLEEAQWFCVNGGTCTGKSNINKKCNCQDGWTGPHCEFKMTDEDAPKEEDCALSCSNGGQCKHGVKNYGAHADVAGDPASVLDILSFENHDNNMHCVCKDGYTGLTCDVEVDDCQDGDGNKFFCYNGSKCNKTTMEDGAEKHYCDCEVATKKGEHGYAGEFCQYKSTSWCDPVKGMKEDLSFCVNYGECPEDKKHAQCFCPPGFTGHQCEVRGQTPPACKLNCKNGGVCRAGIADDGHLEKFDLPFQKGHIDFEHCSCPEGYTGVDCSIELEICGDMEHVCAHGAKCKSVSGGWFCDCKGAKDKTGKPVAGKYCEASASDICTMRYSEGGHSFCVNGGVCAAIIASSSLSHPGCSCPDGFEGPHCEFLSSPFVPSEASTPHPTTTSSPTDELNLNNSNTPEGGQHLPRSFDGQQPLHDGSDAGDAKLKLSPIFLVLAGVMNAALVLISF